MLADNQTYFENYDHRKQLLPKNNINYVFADSLSCCKFSSASLANVSIFFYLDQNFLQDWKYQIYWQILVLSLHHVWYSWIYYNQK